MEGVIPDEDRSEGHVNRTIVHHMIISGHSGESGSVLDRLNNTERQALAQWAQTQPSACGVVDLMRWPGWTSALLRRQADMQAAWEEALDVVDRIKSRISK